MPPKAASPAPAAQPEEPKHEWWKGDVDTSIAKRGAQKWSTLEHNGLYFPPPYVPHHIPIKYEGKEFRMTQEEEEVATMYAVLKESDYYRNPIFKANFFAAWKAILDKRSQPHPIKKLELCSFEAIYQWYVAERDKRNNRTSEEKKKAKAELEAEMAPYQFCLWDGRKEPVANFRVEPPGLFRGRGKHPLQGCLKKRLFPEDITLNMSKGAKVPECMPGHKWKEIVHDNTVSWLAMFKDTVTENFKYVMMAPSSTIKGVTDREKFEKARRLKNIIDDIRAAYRKDFASPDAAVRQRAVATYFIDKLALRVGNEKGEDEADTVGCCSLRFEHVIPIGDNKLRFDFLGKDSVRYLNEVEVDPTVYRLVESFRLGKKEGVDLFDRIDPQDLNEHFKEFMPGLSAKVFRTYNASVCLQEQLEVDPPPADATLQAKLIFFNRANTQVAILCNHQKGVSKNHEQGMATMKAKLDQQLALLKTLEDAKKLEVRVGRVEAMRLFLKKEDEMQWEWLNAHGTDEQKEEYRKEVAARPDPASIVKRVKSEAASKSPARPKSAKGTSKKSPSSAGKKSSPSAKPRVKNGSAAPDEKQESDSESSSSDDEIEDFKLPEEDEEEDSSDSSSSSDDDDEKEDSSSSSSSSSSSEDEKEEEEPPAKKPGGKKAPPAKKATAAKKSPPSPKKSAKSKISPPPSPVAKGKAAPKPAAKKARSPSPPPSPAKGKKAPAAPPKGKAAPKPAAKKARSPSPPPPPSPARKGGRGKASRDEDEEVPLPKKPAPKRR